MTAREQTQATIESDVQSLNLESLRLINMLLEEAQKSEPSNEHTLRFLLGRKAEILAQVTK